jgi:polyhydroxybutyrate depolymerase
MLPLISLKLLKEANFYKDLQCLSFSPLLKNQLRYEETMKNPKLRMTLIFLLLFLPFAGLKAKSVNLESTDPNREDIKVFLPKDFKKQKKWPLIISLHGFGGNSSLQNYYVRLRKFENDFGYVFAAPNGIKNKDEKRFWNGSNFCCDFEETQVNDVHYIKETIARISKHPQIGRIDLSKIFLIGYSNGAFLASRIACESDLEIAGLVTMAGTSDLRDENYNFLPLESLDCPHQRPIKFLHVHGTNDETIRYEGFDNGKTGHVSAIDHLKRWAHHNNCNGEVVKSHARLNASNFIKGKDTEVYSWKGCDAQVRHFKVLDGGHFGIYKKSFTKMILKFLFED